jgi:metal-responsive CopG/Arc/MetJ family transcriptional regulator
MGGDRLKESKVRLTIVVTKEMRDQLDKLAEGENRNRSNYIENVLKEHLSKPDKQ